MQSNTSIRALRPQAGFTLIELMIVILLGAILMGMAIPSFRSLMAGNRLTTQANDLVGAINYARSEAISHNTTVTFCRANLDDLQKKGREEESGVFRDRILHSTVGFFKT